MPALFAKIKKSSGIEIHHFIETLTNHPIKIQNGLFHTYCINMYGIIQQNEKGKSLQHIQNRKTKRQGQIKNKCVSGNGSENFRIG